MKRLKASNKMKNTKKFQPLFDWNCEIEDTTRKEKESTFRPLSAFSSEL